MSPEHDEPTSGLGDFDPEEDSVRNTLSMLVEVMAARDKLHLGTFESQKTLAEVLLAALDAEGSQFCAGCKAARKVAGALRDTATDRIEAAQRESDAE